MEDWLNGREEDAEKAEMSKAQPKVSTVEAYRRCSCRAHALSAIEHEHCDRQTKEEMDQYSLPEDLSDVQLNEALLNSSLKLQQ